VATGSAKWGRFITAAAVALRGAPTFRAPSGHVSKGPSHERSQATACEHLWALAAHRLRRWCDQGDHGEHVGPRGERLAEHVTASRRSGREVLRGGSGQRQRPRRKAQGSEPPRRTRLPTATSITRPTCRRLQSMQGTRQFCRRLSCPLSATHSRSARTTSPCATFSGFKVCSGRQAGRPDGQQ